jgi:purine-binding chemotaxis protein CheW
MIKSDSTSNLFLICRSDPRLCALPLGNIVETMRSLPIKPMPDMPSFLLGVAIIRGDVVPVVDVASLLGANTHSHHARFVTIKIGERRVAFAVDDVIGVRTLDNDTKVNIPPLLDSAEVSMIEAMSTLDAELLLVLQGSHLIPESIWSALDAMRASQ